MSLLSQNVMKLNMHKVIQHRSVSQSPLYPIMTHKSVKILKSNSFQKTQLIASANYVTFIPPLMSISTNVVSIVRKNDMATPYLLMVTPYQGIRQFSTSNAKNQLVPSKKKSDVLVPTGEKGILPYITRWV